MFSQLLLFMYASWAIGRRWIHVYQGPATNPCFTVKVLLQKALFMKDFLSTEHERKSEVMRKFTQREG